MIFKFSSNGGSSWISTGYYWRYINWDNSASGELGGNNDSLIALTVGQLKSAAGNGLMLSATIYNPKSAAFFKGINWQFTGVANGTQRLAAVGGATLESTTACDSFQLYMDNGNIQTMLVRVYGVGQ